MLTILKNLSQQEGDESTINVKRTTVFTVGVIVLVVFAAMVLLAFYASFKALSAASAVDDAWQTQRERILNIEAKSVQASTDAEEVKLGQAAIQQGLLDANKRLTSLKQSVEQATSYRSTMASIDAEKAAEHAKTDAIKAEAQKAVEASEQKGVENFDRLLLARLHSHWVRPDSAAAGATVDVVVQFAADGTITNALLPTSSGSQALDDSIVKAAADLAKIPEMSTVSRPIYMKYLQQRTVKFQI